MDISLIICTRNNAKSLGETLQSIRRLKYDNRLVWEVIVVDNNSQDETKFIVEKFFQDFELKTKYLFESKIGIPFARNKGINHATGDIITFTDDDCELDPDYLMCLHEIFSSVSSSVGLVGGKIVPVWIDHEPPEWFCDFFHGPLALLNYGEQPFLLDYKRSVKDKRLFYGASLSFRKEVFDQVGLFDVARTYAQDTEMCQRILNAGIVGYYAPQLMIHHKISSNRLKAGYFYKWFYRRGQFWYEIKEEDVKFFHPLGVPLWLVKKALIRFLRSIRIKKLREKIIERCYAYYYLGLMIKQIKKNLK